LSDPFAERGLDGFREQVEVLHGLELLNSLWREQANGERDHRLALALRCSGLAVSLTDRFAARLTARFPPALDVGGKLVKAHSLLFIRHG
jgi:hypothetical protein